MYLDDKHQCCVRCCCVGGLEWCCMQVSSFRFSIYNIFLLVPLGLVRGLATMQLNLQVRGDVGTWGRRRNQRSLTHVSSPVHERVGEQIGSAQRAQPVSR